MSAIIAPELGVYRLWKDLERPIAYSGQAPIDSTALTPTKQQKGVTRRSDFCVEQYLLNS